jgi:hypothetical protein
MSQKRAPFIATAVRTSSASGICMIRYKEKRERMIRKHRSE